MRQISFLIKGLGERLKDERRFQAELAGRELKASFIEEVSDQDREKLDRATELMHKKLMEKKRRYG